MLRNRPTINSKDLLSITQNINNKEIIFDNLIDYINVNNPLNTKQRIPDPKSIQKCSSVLNTLEKCISKERSVKLTVPIQILNYFTDLSSKSSDIYAKLDAEKLLLTKVRLQMKQFNTSRSDKPPGINDMTWIDYLVLFVDQTIKLLKKCIANLFSDVKLHTGLQLSSEVEALAHYNTLMYSTEQLSVELKPHNYITEVMKSNNTGNDDDDNESGEHFNWYDKLFLETRSREISVLKAYLSGSSKLPGLIYGPAGSGRSSLLRWAVHTFEQLHYKPKSADRSTPQTAISNQASSASLTQQSTIEPIVIVCCIGRTCLSTSLQSVLVQIIEQLALKFQVENESIKSLCEYAEAVRLLNTMLNYASALRPVLIVIDNIEYLYPDEHVQMFLWLPYTLHNQYTRVLMTTSATRIVKGFNNRFGEGCCITLSAFSQIQHVITTVMPRLIRKNLEELGEEHTSLLQLTQSDQDLINTALQKNITPSYIKLLAEIIAVKLTGKVDDVNLPETLPSDISHLFVLRLQQIQSMLKQQGLLSVALLRILPYIACSRFGLTFSELIEILQSDNDIQQVRKRSNQVNSLQHFPIGCLQHLMYSLKYGLVKYLMFITTDNRLLVTFTSDAFRKGVLIHWGFNTDDLINHSQTESTDDYNTSNENKDEIDKDQMIVAPKEFTFHKYLSDYWLGNYTGQDDYEQQQPSQQTSHPYEKKSNTSDYNEDAFNTMYYWMASEKPNTNVQLSKANASIVTGTYDKRYMCNARRLTELPYQLLQAGSDSVQDILKHVIFSFDYILGKLLLGLRPNDVITEFYYMRQLNQLRTNDEIMYLLGLIRSLSTKLSLAPTLLSVELAGRIGHLANSEYVNIGRQLLNSIDSDSNKVNCLLPLLSICYTPALQPELLQVKYTNYDVKYLSPRELQQHERKEVITISSDSRFLFTLIFNNYQMNTTNSGSYINNNEVLINLWEVNSLTKANSFSLGKWPDHIFHQAYMPTHQNQMVLLTYSTKTLKKTPRKSGILAINLELGCVEGELSVTYPIQLKILCISRASIVVTRYGAKENEAKHILSQGYATVYSLPNLQPITGVLSKVPLPFYISPTDRICFGPSRWLIQGKTGVDKKRKRNSTEEMKDAANNSVQVRLRNAVNDVVAWIKCPLAPGIFQTNIRGENLLIGCKSLGQIYRFDLTTISGKEVRILKPNMELNLYKNIKNIIQNQVSELSSTDKNQNNTTTPFLWDSDALAMLDQARHQVCVQELWVSPDEKYLAALYNVNDYRLLIGIWHISSRLLIAGLSGYQDSQIRFGIDTTGACLIHFIKSSDTHTWIELVELNTPQLTQMASGRPITTKSSGNISVRLRRIPAFKTAIDEAYFIRGGNLIVVTNGSIILTSINVLSLGSKSQGPMALTLIGKKLSRVNYHPELDIVYSTEIGNQQLFTYYNLITQRVISVECTKSEVEDPFMNSYEADFLMTPILDDTPCERHLSSDGKRLALVYRVKSLSNNDIIDHPSKSDYKKINNNNTKDYRKPKLPNINYYTSLQEKIDSPIGMGYDQTIIRLYDLDNTTSGTGLRCQISIIGEFIFHMSTKHGIYTLKPDHASTTRLNDYTDPVKSNLLKDTRNKNPANKLNEQPQALLSRYESTNGRFLGYTFLQHPVIKGTQIVFNDRYLVLCCGEHGQWIRFLEAPDFKKILYEVNLQKLLKEHDDYCRKSSVQRIFTCRAQPTIVIVQYIWLEQENSMFNITVLNLKNKQDNGLIISQMSIADKLIDVSPDGIYGLDANLRLIDFRQGSVLAMLNSANLIPGTQNEPIVLCAQFTPDKVYIVSVLYSLEYHNAWLVIIQNNQTYANYPVVGRALLTPIDETTPISTESSELPIIKLQLGHNGRLIVVKMDTVSEFKLFTIRKRTKGVNLVYSNANDRLKGLLPIDKGTSDENNSWSSKQKKAKYLDELFIRFAESLSTNTSGNSSEDNCGRIDDEGGGDGDDNDDKYYADLLDIGSIISSLKLNSDLLNQGQSYGDNSYSADTLKC
uniref:ORC1/DEAH AAA+ ATPase domain-containing protein n=1 Tax=Trichobilharzia regenti TaxID=157069 RepID=A0AA85K9N6_TRIRE|nr:unnamed protein product [Trichobilharzia regenti]